MPSTLRRKDVVAIIEAVEAADEYAVWNDKHSIMA